ncbi:MAG: hypothetical protein RI572_03465 [Salegentibacter sp.]|uniref:Outer membrane protein beta-barrel domain-containing protein n=1 Tax=Salegentibacter flavus TaxID=287099 RepID=A0A1I4XU12_9FLAO|nr:MULTISPECIES: hypothetical protein [Salegentibacter]MDR9456449.1 hypothetical protein [Salegentibacter sp.]SFN28883.1 hypothetical protein SAMN05660413_00294 [Salegentibacter flavus]
MKTIIIYLVVSLSSLLFQEIYAQSKDSDYGQVETLEKLKKEIVTEEKEELKKTVTSLNRLVEQGKITAESAMLQKETAAGKHAKNIENRITILENKFALESRNSSNDKSVWLTFGEDGKVGGLDTNPNKYDRRTTNDLVIAAGFNNALEDGQSLNDSDFKLAGSRFFEIGWAWKTRVFKNTNWLRFRYGVSFQFNGLKPVDNQIFEQDGNETYLTEFNYDLKKSKFRMDNLVVPVHFEFGPSTKIETDRSIRYSTVGKLKIGLGGYAGLNIGERQKLKYEVDGEKIKEKLKNDYNTNDFVYGLSAYLGWGGATLYGKYDLNPIFKDPNRELHNFSLGLRFDVD